MKKMRILIVADGFGAPSYNPRLRSLCDYLSAQGHDVQVVCEYIQPLGFKHQYPIEEYRLYSGSSLDWVEKNIWSLITDWKNRAFSSRLENQFGDCIYDIVFCTTFHTLPLRAAMDFGQRHHLPVVADLRDIMEQAPGNQADYLAHHSPYLRWLVPIYQYINRVRRNRQIRKATHVTSVSPWHVQFLKAYNPNCTLIYNGYDEQLFQPEDQLTPEFIISYSGKYFGLPIHNADMLFEALQQVNDIPYRLIIHTNEEGQKALSGFAQRYNVMDRIHIEGYVPIDKIIDIYHQSAIVVVLTNKATNSGVHGLMTTKFFEAMGVEKPILCVRSDEECLSAVLNETHAGIAARTADEAANFIRKQYKQWQQQGFTRQEVKNKQIFSRQHEAQQFEQLFLSCLNH